MSSTLSGGTSHVVNERLPETTYHVYKHKL
jgi:hypothetical protein